jgi:hypothetical protein
LSLGREWSTFKTSSIGNRALQQSKVVKVDDSRPRRPRRDRKCFAEDVIQRSSDQKSIEKSLYADF